MIIPSGTEIGHRMSFAGKKIISIKRSDQKVYKVVVITLAKNLGEGSYPTEK